MNSNNIKFEYINGAGMGAFSKRISRTVSMLLTAVIFFLAPAFGVSAIDSEREKIVAAEFEMMSTFVQIKVATSKVKVQSARKAIEQAKNEMQALVDIVSSWDPNSDTSKINSNAGIKPVEIDPQLIDILVRAQGVSEISNGAFDLTFSPLAKLWKLSADNPVIPDESAIKQKLKLVDYRKLQLNPAKGQAFLVTPSMRIDLGGIAKGAVIDAAAESLKANGFENFMVNAGGDLRAMGSKSTGPWNVGITDPRNPGGSVIGKITLSDNATATSGDYEKMVEIDGKRYHHILNPRTGRPADKCISATVIASDAITADAFSTAFFVLGSEDGIKLCEQLDNIEVFFILPDLSTARSSGFPDI